MVLLVVVVVMSLVVVSMLLSLLSAVAAAFTFVSQILLLFLLLLPMLLFFPTHLTNTRIWNDKTHLFDIMYLFCVCLFYTSIDLSYNKSVIIKSFA